MEDNKVKHISYDKEGDILALHKGFGEDESFEGNLDSGDIILDISTKKQVRGIEIMNASTLLRGFNISKETLSAIDKAELKTSESPSGITVSLKLISKGTIIPAKFAVVFPKKRRNIY
ncbi:MAG: DUF2283 domain-containing protein [Candidatus Woesearchaeota archaeon]